MKLILIQRDDCELCDQAWERLAQAGIGDFESRWIDGDAGWLARYGSRVPVLRDDDGGQELDWPFDAEAVRRFIAEDRES